MDKVQKDLWNIDGAFSIRSNTKSTIKFEWIFPIPICIEYLSHEILEETNLNAIAFFERKKFLIEHSSCKIASDDDYTYMLGAKNHPQALKTILFQSQEFLQSDITLIVKPPRNIKGQEFLSREDMCK